MKDVNTVKTVLKKYIPQADLESYSDDQIEDMAYCCLVDDPQGVLTGDLELLDMAGLDLNYFKK